MEDYIFEKFFNHWAIMSDFSFPEITDLWRAYASEMKKSM